MKGTYSIIRLVPCVKRGECMNFGVVLNAGGEYAVRSGYDPHLLSAFEPDGWGRAAIEDTLRGRQWEARGLDECARKMGVVQFSRPLPLLIEGAIEDRADELAAMFLRSDAVTAPA